MTDTLNRRQFLKRGTLAAVALAPAIQAADAPAKKRTIQKAIMYATIGYQGSVLEKFQAVKAAGFEGVEPMSHMNQDEVLKALEDTGLKAASVCCSTHWDKPLSDPDERGAAGRPGGPAASAARTPSATGPPRCCWCPAVVNKEVTYDECFKRSVAEIKKAGARWPASWA